MIERADLRVIERLLEQLHKDLSGPADCAPLQRVLEVADRAEQLLAPNDDSIGFAVFNMGPGDVYWAATPQIGATIGMPILAAGGPTNPYVDRGPGNYRGAVYAQATAANTKVVVIEWTRI